MARATTPTRRRALAALDGAARGVDRARRRGHRRRASRPRRRRARRRAGRAPARARRELRAAALRALREAGVRARDRRRLAGRGSPAANRSATTAVRRRHVSPRTTAPAAPQRGGPHRVLFLALGARSSRALAIGGLGVVGWVVSVATSAPDARRAQADRPGRDLARLRRRRPAARASSRPTILRTPVASTRRSRRRQGRDGRDRGPALLRAQGRRLRGHRPRGDQEPRVRRDVAGRLDADDAARPQPLHRRRASARSSARSARPSSPRSSRTATPAARARSGSSPSTSTTSRTARSAARPRSASRPRRACSSTSRRAS